MVDPSFWIKRRLNICIESPFFGQIFSTVTPKKKNLNFGYVQFIKKDWYGIYVCVSWLWQSPKNNNESSHPNQQQPVAAANVIVAKKSIHLQFERHTRALIWRQNFACSVYLLTILYSLLPVIFSFDTLVCWVKFMFGDVIAWQVGLRIFCFSQPASPHLLVQMRSFLLFWNGKSTSNSLYSKELKWTTYNK